NPIIDLDTAGTPGTYTKVTTDAYGRVTSGTTLSAGDLPADGYASTYVNVSGDTMTGFLTLNADPTDALHAATKQYSDSVISNILIAGSGLIKTGNQIDVVGTAGRIVANTDSIDLATAGTPGTYTKVTTDAYGRVTSGTTLSAGDLPADGYASTYVNVSGDTMTGFLTLNADPTDALHAATKQYVDNSSLGIEVKSPVRAATTGSNITLSGTHTIDDVILNRSEERS